MFMTDSRMGWSGKAHWPSFVELRTLDGRVHDGRDLEDVTGG